MVTLGEPSKSHRCIKIISGMGWPKISGHGQKSKNHPKIVVLPIKMVDKKRSYHLQAKASDIVVAFITTTQQQ